MIAEELINQMIPPLKTTDTTEKALNWMEEFRLRELPVVDDSSYKGIISENLLFDSNDHSKLIEEYPLKGNDIFATPQSHFYEVIKLAIDNHLQLIPVLDDKKKFLGVISVNETAAAMAQMFASQGPGGIIVLSLKENDYSLSQISRLVESNDAKILSAFIANDESNPQMKKLTLKLNKSDLSRVIATLERYDYQIIAQFQETEFLSKDKERFDLLLKYLNI